MKKLSPLLLSAFLLISGCTIGDGSSDDVVNEIPPENPTPPPAPVTEEIPSVDVSENVASGLIPSGDPTARLAQANDRKGDPFSLPKPSVVIQYVEPPFTENESGISSGARVGFTNPPDAGNGMTGAGNGETGAGNGGVINRPDLPIIPEGETFEPPAPPEPIYARSILVSGIIDVGGENIALISTPDNNVSRIRVGDVISDGDVEVFVKDIELSRPSQTVTLRDDGGLVERSLAPLQGTVILEQFGENIIKNIGQSEMDNPPES